MLETSCGYGYGPARKSHRLVRISKGRRERTGHRGRRGAFRKQRPYIRTNRFQGDRSLQRKENSSRGSRRRLLIRLRYRTRPRGPISVSGFGNINSITFRKMQLEVVFCTREHSTNDISPASDRRSPVS